MSAITTLISSLVICVICGFVVFLGAVDWRYLLIAPPLIITLFLILMSRLPRIHKGHPLKPSRDKYSNRDWHHHPQ